MEAMFTLTCLAARLSPAKDKRHDGIRIHPTVNQNDQQMCPSFEQESSIMPELGCPEASGQSIALLHWFRRLRIRWEIRDDIHEAFLSLACAIICWRRLRILSLC
jgi:hypothetical protein